MKGKINCPKDTSDGVLTKSKKYIFAVMIICLLLVLASSDVWAAKKRLRRGKGPATTGRTYTRGVRTSVKFRPDRKGLLINFSDFGNVASVTYTLNYAADGVPQGAMGTATPETAGQQRELLFGTCSGGVCRWHTNIQNARLVINSKLKSGLTIRKPYRIKI